MMLPLSGAPWLERIPNHWDKRPIAACFKERNEQNSSEVMPTLLSLSYGHLKRKDAAAFDGLRPASYATYQMLYPGDVVLRLLDLQNDKRSVRVGQATEPGIITSAYVGLDCSWWGSARYAYYLLLMLDVLKVFYGIGSGMRQSITFSDLGRVPIAIPSHQEQTAIAAYLDVETARIDALIAEKKGLLDALDQLKSSRITQVLTGAERPLIDTGNEWLPKIPEGWNLVRLKFLGQVRSGIAKGKTYERTSMVEVPYLRVANVQDGYLDLSTVSLIEVTVDEAERYALKPFDVLMNEGGDYDKVGRGAMWSGEVTPCIHQNHVFSVRLDDVSIAPWLAAVTRTAYAKFYFMNNSKQSTNLASISQGNVKEFPVVLPPEAERGPLLQSLNEELLRFSDLAEHAREEMNLLAELRSTTITDAVLGRIDVRTSVQNRKELEAA